MFFGLEVPNSGVSLTSETLRIQHLNPVAFPERIRKRTSRQTAWYAWIESGSDLAEDVAVEIRGQVALAETVCQVEGAPDFKVTH